jgi:hypothetical protein
MTRDGGGRKFRNAVKEGILITYARREPLLGCKLNTRGCRADFVAQPPRKITTKETKRLASLHSCYSNGAPFEQAKTESEHLPSKVY